MNRDLSPVTYLLASKRNGTLYIGVTSNLTARIDRHRRGLLPGFTRDYGVRMLVWFERHETMEQAILREKRIQKWNRGWKLALIERTNPDWRDLGIDLGFAPLATACCDRVPGSADDDD